VLNTTLNNFEDFWHDTCRYGVIHYSAEKQQRKTSCLLIFVHGVFGDASATWGKMPRWVLENAEIEMNVLSFAYPSKWWHRTSISQAADDLQTWVEMEFGGFRHVIFVTHSTGGLVVKQLLNRAYESAQSNGLWGKTRQVINIAVPHTGGSPFLTTTLSVFYGLVYPLLSPVLRLTRFLTQGKKDWGRNRIIPALRWRNRWLLELEDQFCKLLQKSFDSQHPTPVIVDICAESDQSVPQSSDQLRRQIRMRGTHKTVKVPRRSSAPIVGIVANIVRQYAQDLSLTVVDQTLMRIAEVNHAANFKILIKSAAEHGSPNDLSLIPTTRAEAFGSQDNVYQFVTDRVMATSDRPTRIVVTGAGGVGKSTVLRMITWRLGRDFLASPGTTPIPLFIPLQQITVTDISEQTYSWEGLWAWWLHWAHSLFPEENCTMDWLEKKFESEPVAIILDGLDDFLVNHPNISLSTIVRLLRLAVHQYSSNTKLSIVIAIRNDIHGLDRLADDPSATYEILPLSQQQAIETFPDCKPWLPSVQNKKLLGMILTPLVLNNYRPPAVQRLESDVTQASILNQIVETFLRNSRLVGTRLADTSFVELDHLFIALSIIAWLFFYQSRGEIHRDDLCAEAMQLRKRWQQYFANQGQSRENEDFITACTIIENAKLCTLLSNSDVFLSTGSDKFRFTHRSWQELLLARFFINCIRYRYFDDFGCAKLYSGIYRMAGDMYRGPAITSEQVQCVIDTWRNTGNTYVTGNFIGFISWTVTPIDAQAIQLLLDEFENFKGLSRVILVGGLGYRLLVNDPRDRSISDIRHSLFSKFIEYSNPASCPIFAPVASSLAWCYQKAFAQLFGIQEPNSSWPELHFDDKLTLKILPMVANVTDDKPFLTDESKSLQQALLTPILDTYQHPQYVIRAVHYLYLLVIAEKHRVHAFAVSQEVPLLLAPGSEFENLVTAFDLVPEVMDLYRSCQHLHRKLELVIT